MAFKFRPISLSEEQRTPNEPTYIYISYVYVYVSRRCSIFFRVTLVAKFQKFQKVPKPALKTLNGYVYMILSILKFAWEAYRAYVVSVVCGLSSIYGMGGGVDEVVLWGGRPKFACWDFWNF